MFEPLSTQANKLVKLTKKISSKKSKTRVLTVTSGKGGVGKSTFCVNSAYLLAKRGLKVVLLDADIGLANLQVLLDIKPQNTFFDYIEGRATLDDVLLKTKFENLNLLAGKNDYKYTSQSNAFVIPRLVGDILDLSYYDVVIIDTGAGINDYVKEALNIADNVLALTTTDPSALTDLYALMKMLAKDKSELLLCFNQTDSDKTARSISNSLISLARKNDLSSQFVLKYIGNISSSANIAITGRLRKVYVYEFANQKAAEELNKIVDRMLVLLKR